MDVESAKAIGAGLAAIALIGAGIGIGLVFAAFVSSIARNPAAEAQMRPVALLGFALAEATGLFGMVMGFIIFYVF
jgi:F0F1-type ATP synthase membrane subunit c/vacuolar-type H+-ATPase subunit K